MQSICVECGEPYRYRGRGFPSTRCQPCKLREEPTGRTTERAYEADGIVLEKKQMRRCLALDHDHYFMTTKAVRLCKAARKALDYVDSSPSLTVVR